MDVYACRYNPFVQARGRVDQLRRLGHSVDKVEYILMGGTFMSLPLDYRDYFVRNLHDALSGHSSSSVHEAVRPTAPHINAKHQSARPDRMVNRGYSGSCAVLRKLHHAMLPRTVLLLPLRLSCCCTPYHHGSRATPVPLRGCGGRCAGAVQ